MESHTSEIRTMCPGVVVSFDAARNRAVVRPSLPLALADGRTLDAPTIHEVPIAWPNGAGGRFLFTWPLEPGDPVELRFAQRSMEGWLSGNEAAPDDPRRFDLSDCVADPCLKATGIRADPSAMRLHFDGTEMRFEPGGVNRIISTHTYIENPTTIIGNAEIRGNLFVGGSETLTGNVTAGGNVIAGTVSLQGHAHTASGGSGIGGPPVL